MKGNCKGLDVLGFDFCNECDEDYLPDNDCNLQFDDDTYCYVADLKNANGETLSIKGDADKMNDCIVGIEITDFIEE